MTTSVVIAAPNAKWPMAIDIYRRCRPSDGYVLPIGVDIGAVSDHFSSSKHPHDGGTSAILNSGGLVVSGNGLERDP
ncbi:hypothetical protein C487_04468 [Natrinema pallidum DSM 3751]|uniref:Uncharacterized protein n=1 Tax=Natrinema pallidum DSM 3751 TaxID=1227495 RepID=L9Z3X0_9EURY|nr:hypothetical protein C487_04468 [Natrinema pallidum DSM 3751]